jgi:hypothetical protein
MWLNKNKYSVLGATLILLSTHGLISQNVLLDKYFSIEGNNPYISDNCLAFDALKSKYLSPNGHGWRNELKKKDALRRDLYNTVESISADITFRCSPGVKTVFTQYHENNTSTLLLLFIADINDKQLSNGIAKDGVFDIYFIATQPNGNKVKMPLGVAKSNETFKYSVMNQNGNIEIGFNDKVVKIKLKDSPKVYLKIGNYLQAQDSITGNQSEQRDFEFFYRTNGIVEDEIVFKNVVYKSE